MKHHGGTLDITLLYSVSDMIFHQYFAGIVIIMSLSDSAPVLAVCKRVGAALWRRDPGGGAVLCGRPHHRGPAGQSTCSEAVVRAETDRCLPLCPGQTPEQGEQLLKLATY